MAARPDRNMTAFRATVAFLALIPIGAGAAGVFYGLAFPGFGVVSGEADASSHFRFLSGIFFAMGLAYWSVALRMGNWLERFWLLGLLTIAGGLGRALSLASDGVPSTGHLIGLGMELVVVPLLFFWSVYLYPKDAPER